MKTALKIFALVVLFALSSCSAQRQVASRLTGEWIIQEYEVHQSNGVESRLDNVGTISFLDNGTGSQTFTSAITQMDADNTGNFRWDNTAHTVYITGENARNRKAWIIMDSKRKTQHWRSTDSEGNLQIMHLRRKEDTE